MTSTPASLPVAYKDESMADIMAPDGTPLVSDIRRINRSLIQGEYHVRDPSQSNLLLNALLEHIPTYAIHEVIFHTNGSSRTDEIIALRLGLCVLDHRRLQPEHIGVPLRVAITGPHRVSTTDLDLPFTYPTPLLELRAGEELIFDVIVRQGTGYQHRKFQATCCLRHEPSVGGFLIFYNDVYMIPPRGVFLLALANIDRVLQLPPEDKFFGPSAPL